MSVILKHRRMLPAEVAAQVIPISQIQTAQEHASKVLPMSVSSLPEMHLEIKKHAIPQFTEDEQGERLVSFYCSRHDSFIVTLRPVPELLRITSILRADAMYQVVPFNLAEQLFCLNGSWNYVSSTCTMNENYNQNSFTLEVLSLFFLIAPLCFPDWGCRLRVPTNPDQRSVQGSVQTDQAGVVRPDYSHVYGGS